MISNYIKTAFRSAKRDRLFTVLNIAGLAIGLASSLLIILWTIDERSIDSFHKNGASLFQVYERDFFDGKVQGSYATQGLLAEELRKSIPGIRYAAGMEGASAPGSQTTFEVGDKAAKFDGAYVGADFLTMFSYPLLAGNATSAISEPASLVISKTMALQFFGSVAGAVGQLMRVENSETLKVTAVMDDISPTSSQHFDFLRCWKDFVRDNDWVNNWGNTDPQTFVQLQPGAHPKEVEAAIRDFIYQFSRRDKSFVMQLALQPYSERYLHSNISSGYPEGGRIEYVRIFTMVAVFILLIACINFMNLATAKSSKRAREVGIRKVVGALRSKLILQFIGEALALTAVALLLAILIAQLLLPAFNELTGKAIRMPFEDWRFASSLVLLLLVTGTVAGSYPAFVLSNFQPGKVLKSARLPGGGSAMLRQVLVVFQFALSIILIIGTIVVGKQIDYVRHKNIGYDRENLVYLPIEGELIGKYPLFKEQALNSSAILNVSKMRNSPTQIFHHTNSISWPAKDPNTSVSFVDGVVGYDFAKTMNVHMAAGRDFSRDFPSDSTGYILNETAVKKIGFTDPVGQTVTWGQHPGKVIGVVSDFHFTSLHEQIEPLILRLDDKWGWGTILVRIRAGQTPRAIAELQKICRELNPAFPFTYQFSDLEFQKLYRSDAIIGQLSTIFAILAVVISCLGLFGLASFTAEQRQKEIGVRKVLGASVEQIAVLFSGRFVKLVIISIVVAFPVAGLLMSQWLRGYAYRTPLEWQVFGAAGAAALFIAVVTVSFQSIRAAMTNPVKTLKTE